MKSGVACLKNLNSNAGEPRGLRADRRDFLKGACLGALGAILPVTLDGLLPEARAEDPPVPPNPAPPAPPAPAPPKLPAMEEVVAEFMPDSLFLKPGKKVLHFYPPEGREKMPKDLKPVEKIEGEVKVNRGHYRAIFKQLLAKYPGELKVGRAAALLDPLEPGGCSRVLGILGKQRSFDEMVPFLDDMDRALEDLAKRDRSVAKKLARLKAGVAQQREKVLGRAKRKRENATEGR